MLPILALLLLAGGGAGAYFYMGKADAAVAEEQPAEKAEEGKEKGGEVTFVPMQPIILPIIDRDGISQTISLVLSIEVSSKEKAAEVEASLPKLADAYLSDMYGTLSKKAAMDGGVIKVSMLKSRLIEITNKVMGEGVVDGVLLQVLQQYPS